MPKNEEGEFELVLGNRQLLSVFFIVVVLLGVFFAMGLLMGRSGAQSNLTEMRKPENSPTDRPMVVDAATRPSAAGDRVPPAETTAKTEPKPQEPERKEPERKEPERKEPERKAEKKDEKKRAEVDLPKPERRPEPPSAAGPGGPPPPGNYLQVAWTNENQAKVVAGIVAGKGHKAYLIPYNDLFRVVVGPTGNREQAAKLLDELKAEGFKPFPRKLP